MSDERRTEGTPHDRLTRLANAGIGGVVVDTEYRDGDKCVVFVSDAAGGGVGLHGYEADHDAIVDVLMHLRAIFRAHGQDLQIHALGGDG